MPTAHLSTRGLLTTYLRQQRWRVLALTLLLLSTIALQLGNPQVLRYFIDAARAGATDRALLLAALLFVVLAFLTQAVSVAATYVSETVGWIATNQLRSDLLRHCLRLDLSFHKARTPGELIERIDGDVTALANFFSQFVIQIVGNGLLLVGVLVVVASIDWRVGAMLAAFATVLFVVLLRVQRVALPHRIAGRQASAELFGFLEERLSGTEDLRSSGAISYTLRRLYERLRTELARERRASVIGALTWATPMGSSALFIGATFALSAWLFRGGAITLGTAYLLFAYTQALLRPLITISRQFEDFQKASAGIARISELYATPTAITDGDGAALPAGPLAVEFDGVGFSYEDGAAVLHDLDLTIPAGRTLGVLGRTGSGKTTMTRLLFRLYDPQRGAVRLAGADLRDLALPTLRGRVGMVTQDVQLFHASLRANLAFFDDALPDDRMLAVLDQAGPAAVVRRAARRPRHGAGGRRRWPLGRRGPGAGADPRISQRSWPGDPRRGLVAPRPGHRAAD